MKKTLLALLLISIDLILLIVVFYIAIYIRSQITILDIPEFHSIKLSKFYFSIIIILTLFFYEGIYKFRYDFWQETLKIIKALFMSFFIVLTILTLTKSSLEYSRLFIIIYFSLNLILFPITRRFIKKIIYSFDFFKRGVLVIGKSDKVKRLRKEIDNNWYLGQKCSKEDYDMVILIPDGISTSGVDKLIEKYSNLHRELFILPYLSHLNFSHSTILEYTNSRINLIEFENKLLNKKNIIIKDMFDKIVSIVAIPTISPLLIYISLLIKKEEPSSSIFFRQKRLGKDNQVFTCYKFRTMYENSDMILEQYLKDNPDEIEYYNKYHKYKNDPRITKIGRFLRKTSLDELPQLINVLKGEMSLVGPRPYMVEENQKIGKYSKTISKVKPGITGLWQVNGRSKLDFNSRIKLDVWYIRNWSLWLDIIILIKTVKVVLKKDGAS